MTRVDVRLPLTVVFDFCIYNQCCLSHLIECSWFPSVVSCDGSILTNVAHVDPPPPAPKDPEPATSGTSSILLSASFSGCCSTFFLFKKKKQKTIILCLSVLGECISPTPARGFNSLVLSFFHFFRCRGNGYTGSAPVSWRRESVALRRISHPNYFFFPPLSSGRE